MPLLDQIQKDMVAAMKAKDEAKLNVVRMVKTALQKYQVDTMKPLDESTELKVLQTLIKQRMDSIDMFRKGGREELAAKEEAEMKMIEAYMPAAASEAEMDAAIAEAIASTGVTSLKQMSVVMKDAQARLAGKRVDGKLMSEKVRGKLS